MRGDELRCKTPEEALTPGMLWWVNILLERPRGPPFKQTVHAAFDLAPAAALRCGDAHFGHTVTDRLETLAFSNGDQERQPSQRRRPSAQCLG